MAAHDSFNRSAFSQFINSSAGRVFRVAAGAAFLGVGIAFRGTAPGVVSLLWSALPLSAGALDLCYISAALGGPISGTKIRALKGAPPLRG